MRIDKALVARTVEKLTERAEDCFERARAQHESADSQHADAERLMALGRSLEADAVALNGEMEMLAARTSPPLQEQFPISPFSAADADFDLLQFKAARSRAAESPGADAKKPPRSSRA